MAKTLKPKPVLIVQTKVHLVTNGLRSDLIAFYTGTMRVKKAA